MQLGVNSSQPAGPGSANNSKQNRLSLIVQSVPGSDAVQLLLLEQVPEIPVAKLAGSGLGAEVPISSMGRDVATTDVQLQFVPVGKLGDELLVSFGFVSAQFVIEVDHREHDAQLRPQLQHDAQQANGIRPA